MFGRYVAVSFEGWSCGLHWDGMAWRHALHHGKQLQVELIIRQGKLPGKGTALGTGVLSINDRQRANNLATDVQK